MDRQTRQIGALVEIGRANENNAREIAFDVARWLRLWPGTTPKMLIRRKGDKEEYPAKTLLEGTKLIWSVDRYDTKVAGEGAMWVVFIDKTRDIVGETPKTPLRVLEGPNMIDPDTPEAELPGWTIKAIDAADRAEAAADRAESAGGGGTGGEGTPGQDGEDGGYYMPSVDDDGNLSWTASKEGMPDIPGANIKGDKGDTGATGKDGKDGKDGYTPQKGVDYFDGAPGKDGQDGADGYTPQRGTDYWTATDKREIVDDVLAALPTWTGGEY